MVPHSVNGLPTHALAVHAAVVLVPLAALLAILFVIPRLRNWAAIPMALVAVGGLLALYVAKASGENLKDTILGESGGDSKTNPVARLIDIHEDRANVLFYLMIAFAVVAVAVYFLYRERTHFTGAVQYVACGLLVIGAVVITVQVIRVGDAGARAVWNPTGTQSYGMAAVSTRP
jgi:formate hydrogenlyase subunit 3/multisubunit Na+/H+ antiporter MnhD subunit